MAKKQTQKQVKRRGRPRKEASREQAEQVEQVSTGERTEKEILLELYETLKARNIRSISDLENQIANAEG